MKLINKLRLWYENEFHGTFIGSSCKYKHTDGGDFFENTGEFIDGKPIQRKYMVNIATCIKCSKIIRTYHQHIH